MLQLDVGQGAPEEVLQQAELLLALLHGHLVARCLALEDRCSGGHIRRYINSKYSKQQVQYSKLPTSYRRIQDEDMEL